MTTTITPKHAFKVGDILVCSWGYGQTNIDFYEVVATTTSTIKIRRRNALITPSGFMCGTAAPGDGF